MNASIADRSIASQILTEHRAGLADAQSAIQHARRAGELLLEAREQCDRGEWLPWLTAYCPEIPERTASRYMQIARCPELEAESVREAILKLASPRKPNNSPRVADSTELSTASAPPPASNAEPATDEGGRPADWSEEDGIPSDAEMVDLDRLQREYTESLERATNGDAQAEIKRQAAEILSLRQARDGFMNGKAAITRLLKREQATTARLERRVKQLETENERLTGENEALRERIAVMEETA